MAWKNGTKHIGTDPEFGQTQQKIKQRKHQGNLHDSGQNRISFHASEHAEKYLGT